MSLASGDTSVTTQVVAHSVVAGQKHPSWSVSCGSWYQPCSRVRQNVAVPDRRNVGSAWMVLPWVCQGDLRLDLTSPCLFPPRGTVSAHHLDLLSQCSHHSGFGALKVSLASWTDDLLTSASGWGPPLDSMGQLTAGPTPQISSCGL